MMEKQIQFLSSAQNTYLKMLKSLQTKKGRRDNGLFLVEDSRLVQEICAPWQMDALVLTEMYY